MNLKTSITIIIGCLVIFLFVMLPIFLSIEKREDDYVKKFQENIKLQDTKVMEKLLHTQQVLDHIMLLYLIYPKDLHKE